MKKKQKKKKSSELQKKLLEKEQELSEFKELLKRVQADFENYKKRAEKQMLETKELANAEFVQKFLSVIDSVENALKKIEEKSKNKEALTGLKLIEKQLHDFLKKEGLQEIKAVGEKFNPELHEAMMCSTEAGKENDIILEEFQKGYLFKGRLLRPSKVKVNKTMEKGVEEK